MWEFLDNVLKSGGMLGLLIVALGAAYAASIRALWNQNQALHRKLNEAQEVFLQKMNALQERRVTEAQEVIRAITEHTMRVDRTMDKLSATLDVLIEISGGGNTRRR